MIEISECTKGSKRLLEFKRFVRLCTYMPVKMIVHWNVDEDDIEIEFPNGHKVSSTLFEGLSDRVTISWLYSLYMLRGDFMLLKCESCGKNFLPGTNKEGLPNGVGFETEDGSIFTICTECINEIGKKFQRCRKGYNDDSTEFR